MSAVLTARPPLRFNGSYGGNGTKQDVGQKVDRGFRSRGELSDTEISLGGKA